MVYRGRVHNGVVVLEGDAKLPDGTEVRVEALHASDKQPRPAIYRRLEQLAGRATGLPVDLAEQHDHYLHGQARK